MHKYFSFEIEALDDKKLKRRFRASNYQVRPDLLGAACWLLRAVLKLLASVLFGGLSRRKPESSHTSAPCHSACPKGGTKCSSTSLTSCARPTALHLWRFREVPPFRDACAPHSVVHTTHLHATRSLRAHRSGGGAVQVHANCRLRRIYFAEKPHAEEELPPEFKLFLPSESKRYTSSLLLTRHCGPHANPVPSYANRSAVLG